MNTTKTKILVTAGLTALRTVSMRISIVRAIQDTTSGLNIARALLIGMNKIITGRRETLVITLRISAPVITIEGYLQTRDPLQGRIEIAIISMKTSNIFRTLTTAVLQATISMIIKVIIEENSHLVVIAALRNIQITTRILMSAASQTDGDP